MGTQGLGANLFMKKVPWHCSTVVDPTADRTCVGPYYGNDLALVFHHPTSMLLIHGRWIKPVEWTGEDDVSETRVKGAGRCTSSGIRG
jgi:hypothetical protein